MSDKKKTGGNGSKTQKFSDSKTKKVTPSTERKNSSTKINKTTSGGPGKKK